MASELSDRAVPAVETCSVLDRELFEHHSQNKRQPIIFRGVDIGSCSSLWTSDYLADKLGDTEAKIHVCSQDKLDFVNKNFVYRSLSLREYIKRTSRPREEPLTDYFMDPNERYYLRSLGADVRRDVSDIHSQYPQNILIGFLPPEYMIIREMRIASPGSQLWTHYDVMDNLLIQIVGDKDIILYPPSDLQYLYLQGDKSVILDPENVDIDKYPLYIHTTKWRCTLKAGDVIFIPALWFHNVTAREFSVAVNVFWRNLDLSLYNSKDVYGNKDLMPTVRAQQGINKALKTLDSLPAVYRDFYIEKLISHMQSSLRRGTETDID